jgi:hypothetical protein
MVLRKLRRVWRQQPIQGCIPIDSGGDGGQRVHVTDLGWTDYERPFGGPGSDGGGLGGHLGCGGVALWDFVGFACVFVLIYKDVYCVLGNGWGFGEYMRVFILLTHCGVISRADVVV